MTVVAENRYPENTIVTIEDFRSSDWEGISESTSGGYYELWQSFSKRAATAIEAEEFPKGKVLWLIADACSLALRPEKINNPFQAFAEIADRRSVLPEDFHVDDIICFAHFAEEIPVEINHAWLKARLSDLVWVTKTPRSFQHALLAINSYLLIPLTTEVWLHGGRECWERAIILIKQLGRSAAELKKSAEAAILAAFFKAKIEDGFFAFWLSELLFHHDWGKDNGVDIADKLASFAHLFGQKNELRRSIEYYGKAAKWYKLSKHEKYIDMTIQEAETWVTDAQLRISSQSQGGIAAISLLERAIQVYRTIPRNERVKHNVNERISELHKLLNAAGEKSLSEMVTISSPAFDMSKYIEHTKSQVKGKTLLDAFCSFANITQGACVSDLRKSAEKMLNEHPLQLLFPATHISKDGRVIAKQSGSTLGDTTSGNYQSMLGDEMVKRYLMEINVKVFAEIIPAMEVLVLEHRLREFDFLSITRQSPIVPSGRERIWAKALFQGYDQDFISALHLLTPQIEHMIRCFLKERKIKTTTLDQAGIETENGLSTLMEISETAHILGEDIAFEIKALYCEAIGPNLRNEVAHGLIDENTCQSVYSIYSWWLGLKMVFNTYWNTLPKDGQQ